jgi:phage I-like protein
MSKINGRQPLTDAQFRMPQDGWVQIAPFGEFPGEVAGGDDDGQPRPVLQVIDAEAGGAILRRFREAASKEGFEGLLVDFDHGSMDAGQSSRAAGWITDMALRDDGLYAAVRWSASGRSAVEGGDYRYLSPVFPWADREDLGAGPDGAARCRLTRIERAGLTNDPGLRGIRAVCRRDSTAGAASAEPAKQQEHAKMKKVLTALGLPDTATEDEAAAALQAKLDRLAELEAKAADAQADEDMKPYEGQIANRGEVKAALVANRATGLKILAAIKPAGQAAVPNRATAADPAKAAPDGKAKGEARAASIRRRAAEIQKAEKVSYQAAWKRAEKEFPEQG